MTAGLTTPRRPALRLERRAQPSRRLALAAPLLAVLVTALFAAGLFLWLGRDPRAVVDLFLVTPMSSPSRLTDLALKMTPLLLCALGLAICYRSGVWNIGAEGQLVAGGLCAGAVALLATPASSPAFFVPVMLAGALGGSLWAGITAWLRIRFDTSEILVSLMLTYIAQLLLLYLVHGALKDPQGYNLPYSRPFEPAAALPLLGGSDRLTIGIVVAIGLAVLAWVVLARARVGLRLAIAGTSPAAARYAGFPPARAIALALGLCGALAGLAGAFEVAGPLNRLTPSISPGYGFAAIVVAWLARLHPLGCIVAAWVVALIQIGGDLAQARLGLPTAASSTIQGVLLLAMLAFDGLGRYRFAPAAPPDRSE